MAKLFTKNDPVWADEILVEDPLYNVNEGDDTPIHSDVKIELATEVAEAGTSLTAARMNNIEDGLDAVDDAVNVEGHDAKTTPVDADVINLWDSVASAWKSLSWANIKATLGIGDIEFTVIIVAPLSSCAIADGVIEFPIPARLNNHNLTGVTGWVNTAGVTGTMDVQVRNKTDAVDMLSTKMTFDSTETSTLTAATPAVIDTTKDDVVTNDIIAVDIDAIHTTAAKGLYILFKWSPQ